MRGLAHIGALEVLQERGLLKGVREYIGISAGSFCAFAICIGCTLSELRMASVLLDFSLMQNITPETAFKFMDTFGLDSGENLVKLLSVCLRTKGLSPTLTFGELAALRPLRLRMFATDLNTCKPREFSAAVTPDVQVVQALRASMSIPIYFAPVKAPDGHLIVDGGVITHMPFALLNRDERETTLSITFATDHLNSPKIETFSAFLAQLYASLHLYHDDDVQNAWTDRTVRLPCGDFPSTHFQASSEEKIQLIDSGRRGMEEFLATKGRAPLRRFSVA